MKVSACPFEIVTNSVPWPGGGICTEIGASTGYDVAGVISDVITGGPPGPGISPVPFPPPQEVNAARHAPPTQNFSRSCLTAAPVIFVTNSDRRCPITLGVSMALALYRPYIGGPVNRGEQTFRRRYTDPASAQFRVSPSRERSLRHQHRAALARQQKTDLIHHDYCESTLHRRHPP